MNKKIIIGIVIFIILALGLVAGLFLVQRQQEMRKKAAPASTLSILPPTNTIKVGDEIDLSVNMNTVTNTTTGAELHITFDPQKLELKEITPGTFLPNIFVQPAIDNTTGTASVTYGAQPANPPQGEGILATLKFKGKSPGTTIVDFGTQTKGRGIGEGASTDIIVNKTGTSITILAPTPTPTPTTSPDTTPTPTQAVGASPTPTPTQTGGSGGGGTQTTPTPTTKPAGGTQTTSTPTPTKKATTVTPTVSGDSLPVSGTSLPTIMLAIAGAIVLFLGIALAL
ncbi:MAG: hypothetical protein HYU80_00935 [Candidatus Blackburnbacteria bacterium]|nr:hypothetical protein [Candidatus Blackburnbacteria bacterium]